VVSWVTRGVFVGERHAVLSPQIDDFFLASAIYRRHRHYASPPTICSRSPPGRTRAAPIR
jgi:hypothetical protein